MAKQSSSDLRNIEIARLAYIGSAIAAVSDAIALIGDGIAAYAAKLTLDALLNPDDDSESAISTGSSAVPIDITPSSRGAFSSSRNSARANTSSKSSTQSTSDDFLDLQAQIDHYINELIEIRDSLTK